MLRDPILMLKDLIRTDTTNPPGEELTALQYISNLLLQEGITSVIQETAPGRGNLAAVLKSAASKEQRPLVLLSHIDVVPADGKMWLHPPFDAVEDCGYIYGRGTVDTKHLTVMQINAFCALAKSEAALCRDVYLLITGDEECGSTFGLKYFLENEIELGGEKQRGSQFLRDSDVISEGGGFPVIAGGREFYLCESGQKGCGSVVFTVKDKLPSNPYLGGGDGLLRAAKLIGDIAGLKLKGTVPNTTRVFIERLEKALGTDAELKEQLSPMMHSVLEAMSANTISVTMVTEKPRGTVTITCDIRLIPGCEEAYIRSVFEELSQKWDCEYTLDLTGWGYESTCDGQMSDILHESTLRNLDNTEAAEGLLPFISIGASDGRFLAPLGARVYGYSPVLSTDMTFDEAVKMVHGVNERIHVDSLYFGCRVLEEAVIKASVSNHRSASII